MTEWINEGAALPKVGQRVLLATPRQGDAFWDLRTARILVRHEGVVPMPVAAGSQWPTDYYWSLDHFGRESCIITGNGWWALMANLPLPPLAAHGTVNGYHCIRQIGDAFVPQGSAK